MVTTFKWLKLKFNRRLATICLVVVMGLALSACSSSDQRAKEETKKETITVFAASSLTDAVNRINEEGAFEVKVNFAGSKTLRTQLENGAQADIFLSANQKHYEALLEEGLLSEGREILQNEMVFVLSKEGAEKIKSLEDLKKSHQLILAEKGVPAGDYGRRVIHQLNEAYGDDYEASVLSNLASSENNVRQVLMKIVLGEGDAALVYKTDITEDIKDKVVVMEIEKAYNITASYWMAIVNNGMISESVHEYYSFMTGEESRNVFESYGFSIVE